MNDTWPKVLASNYEKYGSRKAMRYKHYGIWRAVTWENYYLDVKYLALGLIVLGFEPGDKLLIIGDNAPEWHFAELAAQALHGVSVGVYPDLSPSEIDAIATEVDARFAVCEDQEQVDKLLEIKTSFQKIVYWNYKGLAHYSDPRLIGYREVLDLGRGSPHPECFEAGMAKGNPDDVCVLVYTSGTTAAPRAAVHTFRTLRAGAESLLSLDPWNEHDEVVPASTPAWIMGQWAAIGCHLLSRCILNFPEDPETRAQDTREMEPTVVLYGARFWESQAAALQARMLDLDAVKRFMFRLFMPHGHKKPSFVADLILFEAVRRALGLSRARICYSTGAILSPYAMRFYHALGIPVKSLYATTEGGVLAGPRNDDIPIDTVGPFLAGCEARIIDGEITYRSPGAFIGYYKDPPAKDGWFPTNDAGLIVDGALRFIDRKDSLIGTFAPQAIEAALRFSPFIADAWVFAGGALIVINFPVVARWAGKRKIAFSTFAELARAPEVYDLIRADIDRVNADLPASCRIARYVNFHREFDAGAGEVTRSLNLRRKALQERYRGIVDAIGAGKTSVEAPDGTILTIRGATP